MTSASAPCSRTTAPASRRRRGFSLIELILVLVVLTIIVGMSIPSFRGVAKGRGIEDCAGQIMALSHYARSQAIAEGVTYRLNLDAPNRVFYLTRQDGIDFVDLGVEIGRPYVVPDNVSLEWDPTLLDQQADSETGIVPPARDENAIVPYVEFRPSGRCDPCIIRLTDRDNVVTELVIPSTTETMRIYQPDGRIKQ